MAAHYHSIDGRFDAEGIYELALRRTGTRAARFVELGVQEGRSTCYLAERIREVGAPVELHVVDTFIEETSVGSSPDLWPEFSANLERAGLMSDLRVHRVGSADATVEFAAESLDFAFIGANRGFHRTRRDIALWWSKLRPGGLLAGCGYADFRVAAAVDAFVGERGLAAAFRPSRGSWMIHKPITIDAAYCINLAHRHDRRQQATAQFRAAGIVDWVTFFDAIDGQELAHPNVISDGQAGCTLSHLGVLRAAHREEFRNILIFEDDVRLVPDFLPRIEIALARCPASYDLCYLGVLCNASWGNFLYPFDDLLSRVGHAFGAHAYLVNMERYFAIESGLRDMRTVIDEWYAAKLQPQSNCYCCTPYLAFQSPGYSDIVRRYNGQPRTHYDYVWR